MIQKSIIGQLKAWILLLCKNCMDNLMHAISSISNAGEYMHYAKGPYRPDAIWQRDANFQFSMTFNFNIFQCFSNIRNHLSNFSYLVCISCKIFIRWRFYLFVKTENSRRVAESRPVCLDLKARLPFLTHSDVYQWDLSYNDVKRGKPIYAMSHRTMQVVGRANKFNQNIICELSLKFVPWFHRIKPVLH
jgi:hypothetical protein